MRKNQTLGLVALLAALGAGALAARAGDPSPRQREIPADAMEKAAMDKLTRQGAEIADAQKRLEALVKAHQTETAAIMSLIRSRHLAPGEDFVGWTGTSFAVAFVGTASSDGAPLVLPK